MTEIAVPVETIEVNMREAASGMVVEAFGDLDLVTVSTLSNCYDKALAKLVSTRSDGTLTLDLRGLSFIDSAGLAFLVRIYRELSAAQRGLSVVVDARSQPQRVLSIGRFSVILNIVHSLDEAA